MRDNDVTNWVRWVMTAIPVLFLAFDTTVKVLAMPAAIEPTVALGYAANLVVPIGIILLLCLVLYVVPRTSVLGVVQTVLNASAMASAFSRMKLAKLVADDYSPQALARDGCNSTRLITNAARDAHMATGLMDACRELYKETVTFGHGRSDMISVIRAIEARSDSLSAGG
jgi:hypothetical protein